MTNRIFENTNNRVVFPTNISLEDRNRIRTVVYYGRVSSEHEAQLSALANQMQWYDDQTKYHPNWKVIHKYIDEGITGTQAKKRPAFMQMLADAREHKFDLIVTREVCRFARNTVDTLVVTRELKNIGVEVYFVNDNIWTMDGDGELRLSLMATLAQEESRKTSERVRAGQKISRDKGVLYGNGNILGYDRVGDTYVINPEQAETVRMIYDLYLKGYGFMRIVNELTRLQRKDSYGLVRWECSKISRVLHNATYMGYKCYLKSYRNNYLDQKIIRNHDESTYLYIKGDFEPIISEEVWYRCKELRESKRKVRGVKDGRPIITGDRTSDDLWAKKLVCRCGCRFRKDKWHRNKTGLTYGYKCYNVLNNGSKKSRVQVGLDADRYCDMGAIADWKMDMMAYYIFKRLALDPFDFECMVNSVYRENAGKGEKDYETLIKGLSAQIEKEKAKLDNLLNMRMEGEIDKDEYLNYKGKAASNIVRFEEELARIKREMSVQTENGEGLLSPKQIYELLQKELSFIEPKVKRGLVEAFVEKVIPRHAREFDWYLNLVPHFNFDRSQFQEICTFTIGFDEAHDYRAMRGEMLRRNQWFDVVVHMHA